MGSQIMYLLATVVVWSGAVTLMVVTMQKTVPPPTPGCDAHTQCDDGIACTIDQCGLGDLKSQCIHIPWDAYCMERLPVCTAGARCDPSDRNSDPITGCVVNATAADGTLCTVPTNYDGECCGGTCYDIESDHQHCGGCTPCGTDQNCAHAACCADCPGNCSTTPCCTLGGAVCGVHKLCCFPVGEPCADICSGTHCPACCTEYCNVTGSGKCAEHPPLPPHCLPTGDPCSAICSGTYCSACCTEYCNVTGSGKCAVEPPLPPPCLPLGTMCKNVCSGTHCPACCSGFCNVTGTGQCAVEPPTPPPCVATGQPCSTFCSGTYCRSCCTEYCDVTGTGNCALGPTPTPCPGGCSDGNLCTIGECINGTCEHVIEAICTPNNLCDVPSCDPTTGVCVHAEKHCPSHYENLCLTNTCDKEDGICKLHVTQCDPIHCMVCSGNNTCIPETHAAPCRGTDGFCTPGTCQPNTAVCVPTSPPTPPDSSCTMANCKKYNYCKGTCVAAPCLPCQECKSGICKPIAKCTGERTGCDGMYTCCHWIDPITKCDLAHCILPPERCDLRTGVSQFASTFSTRAVAEGEPTVIWPNGGCDVGLRPMDTNNVTRSSYCVPDT